MRGDVFPLAFHLQPPLQLPGKTAALDPWTRVFTLSYHGNLQGVRWDVGQVTMREKACFWLWRKFLVCSFISYVPVRAEYTALHSAKETRHSAVHQSIGDRKCK